MSTRHWHLRLDRLERDGGFGPIRCSACRSSDPMSLNGLLQISTPLLGPDGECLLCCTRCRQFYRGHVTYENGIHRVDNLMQLHMPN